MAITSSKAKAICTASEFSLVAISGKEQIKQLSAPQLHRKTALARKLRDKWRDQAAKQRRAARAKNGARQTSGNSRSAEKAALFDEVLSRFETEIAKRARKAVPLKVKLKGHRADRAEIRGAFKEKRLELASSAKMQSTKPPVQGAPSSAAESVANEQPPITVPSGKKRSAGRIAKPALPPSAETAAAQSLQTSKRQPRRAKHSRLKAASVVRTEKHVSAHNKRRKAKRD
jgi:hypothetical protein